MYYNEESTYRGNRGEGGGGGGGGNARNRYFRGNFRRVGGTEGRARDRPISFGAS